MPSPATLTPNSPALARALAVPTCEGSATPAALVRAEGRLERADIFDSFALEAAALYRATGNDEWRRAAREWREKAANDRARARFELEAETVEIDGARRRVLRATED